MTKKPVQKRVTILLGREVSKLSGFNNQGMKLAKDLGKHHSIDESRDSGNTKLWFY